MIIHRLKRLIGSFYHQKRIDIIITDNAHYSRNGGIWKQKNVVIHPYAMVTFTRSDGQLQVNNGMTLMSMALTHNDFDGAFIVSNRNGANVTQANTKIWVFKNTNVSGTMREKGSMFITRLG